MVNGGQSPDTGSKINALPVSTTSSPLPVPTLMSPSQLAQSPVVDSQLEPHFDMTTPRNVTAFAFDVAFLSCRVRNLGNKSVSE